MTDLSLEEAIAQLVTLGESDPTEIVAKLERRHGDEWLRRSVAAYATDFATEMARRQLGSVRRRAELALRPGDEITSSEMKIAKSWVPRVGWKAVGDLTREDLTAKAEWYRSLASAAFRRAAWCEEVVELMVGEGAKTVGRLKTALPPLPEVDGLAISA